MTKIKGFTFRWTHLEPMHLYKIRLLTPSKEESYDFT